MGTQVGYEPPATQAPAPRIYTGKQGLGAQLRQMQIDGQDMVRKQVSRWQANRAMYRGEQWIRVRNGQVRTLAPTEKLPSGRRRDSINRMRRFIDGRASLLGSKKPDTVVDPDTRTHQAAAAADVAHDVLDYLWRKHDAQVHVRSALRAGDTDGPAFVYCGWDHTAGDYLSLDFSADGNVVTDPDIRAALQQEGLLEKRGEYQGDVCIRNVRPGTLSIDPLAIDFDEAGWIIESRVIPRAKVEQEAGKKLDDMLRQSSMAMGVTPGYGSAPAGSQTVGNVTIDDYETQDQTWTNKGSVRVHEAFIKPTGQYGDWPKGAHIKWVHEAPGDPYIMEEWDEPCLPYFCFLPQRDDGHFLKTRALADDLGPIQISINRCISLYHELLDLYGRPTALAQQGSIVTKYLFNARRIVEYLPGFSQPSWMQPPPEPSNLLNHVGWLLEQMAEISVQNDVSRGTPPGQGVDAGVSLNILAQRNDEGLGGLEQEVVRLVEWLGSRMLKLAADYYRTERTLLIPGVEGLHEIRNFKGEQIKGATKVRVTGSAIPRVKEQQTQMLMALAQQGALDLTKYLPDLLEGRPGVIVSRMERQSQAQARENDDMDLLGTMTNADALWADFQEIHQKWQKASAAFQESQQTEAPQPGDMTVPGMPASFGPLPPPPPEPTLADIGITIPPRNEWDNDATHIAGIDDRRVLESFDHAHPLVKQAYHEHLQLHLKAHVLNSPPTPQPGMGAPGAGQGPAAPPSANGTPASPPPPASAPHGGAQPQHHTVATGDVNVHPPEVTIHMPQVNVQPAQVHVQAPAPIQIPPPMMPAPNINVAPPNVNVQVMPDGSSIQVIRDENGHIVEMRKIPPEGGPQ